MANLRGDDVWHSRVRAVRVQMAAKAYDAAKREIAAGRCINALDQLSSARLEHGKALAHLESEDGVKRLSSAGQHSWSAVLMRKQNEVLNAFAVSCLKRKG